MNRLKQQPEGNTIREQLNTIAAIVGGKGWGLDRAKPRIYMPSRRDMKVFFDFPDAVYSSPDDVVDAVHDLGGATLKVYIDDCGQHPNWYSGQKRTMFARFSQHSIAITAFTAGDESLAEQIMDLDEVTDELVDDLASHLINGRLDEARARFAEYDA